MNKIKRWVASVTMAALFPMIFAGCYGHFPLVRTVYKFNGSINVGGPKADRFVQSIVMILLAIIQVYSLSTLVDVIIFNVIEFWSGRPVFTAYETEDGSRISMKTLDQNTLQIEVKKDEKVSTFYALRHKPDALYTIEKGQWRPVSIETMEAGELQAVFVRRGNAILDARMQLRSEMEALEENTGLSRMEFAR